ncbi:hypothetical protein K440DRAFT_683217 [Wilcoxina mikolae CBS 423.85]|nr:hypothetical protein K440DRAFT_683217 [Wilcoxina mikolae CBS 423.85]
MAQNFSTGANVMELLLSDRSHIQITPGAVSMIVANFSTVALQQLLCVYPDMQITESIIAAAVSNDKFGNDMIKLLLSRSPDMQIFGFIVAAAASKKWSCGQQFVELLLSERRDLRITEYMVTATTNNRKVMELLLAQRDNIEIDFLAMASAAYFGRVDCFSQFLMRFDDPEAQYQRLLRSAMDGGDDSILKEVLEIRKGSPIVDELDEHGWTLRTVASQARKLSILELLQAVEPPVHAVPMSPTAWATPYWCRSAVLERDAVEIYHLGKN